MNTKEIFERLYNIEFKSDLTPSIIRNYISHLNGNDIKQLLSVVSNDGDKQYVLEDNMRRALSSKNIKPDTKHKIVNILSYLDNISQIVPEEEFDTGIQNKKAIEDWDSRFAVMGAMIEDNIKITEEMHNNLEAKYNNIDKKFLFTENQYKSIDKKVFDVQNSLNDAKKDLQKAANQTGNVINQSITILGIFVAIIAVFLGGFAGITMLDKISTFNTYKFYLSIVVVGHIMINLIFMFIYMLSRIIDKSVSVNCNNYVKGKISINNDLAKDTCQTCCLNNSVSCRAYNKHYQTNYSTCSLFKRLKYKYPYMYFINIVGFLAEIGLCIGWLFDDIIMCIKNAMTQNIQGTIFVSALISLFIITLVLGYKDR